MNETALKERLKVVAKTKGISFNEIWKQLLLERFLARLSASNHHEHFIFKGGLLLAQHIHTKCGIALHPAPELRAGSPRREGPSPLGHSIFRIRKEPTLA